MPRDRAFDPDNPAHLPTDPTTWDTVNPEPFDALGSADVAGERSYDDTTAEGPAHAVVFLAELGFDTLVKADNGEPDTKIQIDSDQMVNDDRLEARTSIDGGQSFQRVHRSSTRIPRIEIGASGLNRKVLAQQVFTGAARDAADVALSRVVTEVHYEVDGSGDPVNVTRTETGAAALALGTLRGCEVVGDYVVPSRMGFLRLNADGGWVRVANGSNNLRLTHGETSTSPFTGVQFQFFNDNFEDGLTANERTQAESAAAFSIEFRLRPHARVDVPPFFPETPDISAGVLFHWEGTGEAEGIGINQAVIQGLKVELVNREFNGSVQKANGVRVTLPWAYRVSNVRGQGFSVHKELIVVETPRTAFYRTDSGDLISLLGQDVFKPDGDYHVAITYDGNWLTILVNGRSLARAVLLRTRAAGGKKLSGRSGVVVDTAGDLHIGRDLDADENLSADLDEIRLWSRRVTPSEVRRRMSRTLSAAEITALEADGLEAYFRSDGGADPDLLPDSTTAGNDGRIISETTGRPSFVSLRTWEGLAGFKPDGTPVSLPYRQSPALDISNQANGVYVATAPFDVLYGGNTYVGVAEFGSLSPIRETERDEPQRVRLVLNGINLAHVSLALTQNFDGRPAVIRGQVYDRNGEPVGDAVVFMRGRVTAMDVEVTDDAASVMVEVESILAEWRRRRARRYTDTEQRLRFPTDRGLEFIAAVSEQEVWWPGRAEEADEEAI